MEFKAGHYVKSEKMQMEGILLEMEEHLPFPRDTPRVTLFCTRDEVYPLNMGKAIHLKLDPKYWEIDNDRA